MSIRGEAQSIDDAVCIAAIETILKPLGSASIKHYMPGPKADAIKAMRGVLMAERAREREVCAEVAIIFGARHELSEAVDAPLSRARLERLQAFLEICDGIAMSIRKPAINSQS